MKVVYTHKWGQTELRAEYWQCQQPGTAITTINKGLSIGGIFDGAFFYFLQNMVNELHQLLVKYDWYDPNTKFSKDEIGETGTNLTPADIKYSTVGLGYVYYFNEHVKLITYYELVKMNQQHYRADLEDNILTVRVQFRV